MNHEGTKDMKKGEIFLLVLRSLFVSFVPSWLDFG